MLEIFPLAEFPSEAVGKANCAVLSTLKASVRNSSLNRSVRSKILNRERSTRCRPGPLI